MHTNFKGGHSLDRDRFDWGLEAVTTVPKQLDQDFNISINERLVVDLRDENPAQNKTEPGFHHCKIFTCLFLDRTDLPEKFLDSVQLLRFMPLFAPWLE